MTTRRQQAGLTLIEVMIASAIMTVMMALAWKTISSSADARHDFEQFEERNQELRMAMGRVIDDFESAYLSHNEDITQQAPRTLMQVKGGGTQVPNIRFSTLNHRPLWADANESEQTVIWYLAHESTEHPGQVDWIRREQRRQSNQPPELEPSDFDVLVHDVQNVKLEFWNWQNNAWQESWDTTQADGQRGQLPSRVRVTITVKDKAGKTYKLTSQARILMQEVLNFLQ